MGIDSEQPRKAEKDNMSKGQKPLTDVEAIAKIARILDKLTPEQRAKVLKFFTE